MQSSQDSLDGGGRPDSRWTALRKSWLVQSDQTWTAAAAAVMFVALAVVISFVPIPYVVWQPGGAWDLMAKTSNQTSAIEVTDAATYPSSGKLLLLTISESRLDSLVSLPEALIAHWSANHDVLPRDVLYPPGKSSKDVEAQDVVQMDTSKELAVVAALREAGAKIDEVTKVDKVLASGPSYNKLKPGDIVQKVDGVAIKSIDEIKPLIAKHKVADTVTLDVLRDNQQVHVSIVTVGGNQNRQEPIIGAVFSPGYSYGPQIKFNIDSKIGGPSGGLVFALGIYEKLTEGDLLAGRTIAGTGEITSDGQIKPIGGIQEKIGVATQQKADVFLVPAANCDDVGTKKSAIRLVKVSTLKEAITALKNLKDPATAKEVPSC